MRTAFALSLLYLQTAHAFRPTISLGIASTRLTATTATVIQQETEPIQGMKPGTSGLRKKTRVWQETPNYVQNFIQSLLDTAIAKNDGKVPHTLLVAGDGRYYNQEAIPIICNVLAANGVTNIWVPSGGIMTTPAVSAAIRASDDCEGAIVLTASHNPGGPDEDFGIKYNLKYGQPAGEDFTNELYDRSLKLSSYKTLESPPDIDVNGPIGTTISLTSDSTVTLIDPFIDYIAVLKTCFDFDGLKEFAQRSDFSLLFDGMHGAGGPFATKVLVDELGLPESSLLRCDAKPDFGGCHPDPNLTYAASLIKRMGLTSQGSADPSAPNDCPTLGAANDGDGDRNLIAGAGCFVTPSDSLAIICDQWEAIPHFTKSNGPKGVARSMPSSAALDVVAKARNIPCFVTPTGWKFFGNLMSSKELFDQTDYTPFLCGEESFGTGSDHIREKDGLWAALAWMSILKHANRDTEIGKLVSVREIVKAHWKKYGRHYYCRYDYEGVDSDKANSVMDLIRNEFVSGDASNLGQDESSISLTSAEEFAYTDPVDGSKSANQGLILGFKYPNGDQARVVFRLSGTGSSGATIRMYLEKYEPDPNKYDQSAPEALQSLADNVVKLVKMQELTGREGPTVVT